MALARLNSLIGEVHRRSLWQVLAVYAVAAWIVLQVVQTLTESLGLPLWFPQFAVLLLLIGLPIVLATAFVQQGAPRLRGVDPTLFPSTGPDEGHGSGDAAARSRPGGAGGSLGLAGRIKHPNIKRFLIESRPQCAAKGRFTSLIFSVRQRGVSPH